MSRPRGSIIGARPTWTTTATSGIWTLRQAEEMKADGKWPRGPEAPTSLAGTAGDEEVALTWTAPATTHGTITDYVVEYTPAAGSPTVVATGSTAASYTLTGLTNGTEYTFRVAAVNHTRGDWSSSLALTPSSEPFSPTSISGIQLWLDASSADTLFDATSGGSLVAADGAVARWEDKSGNARHATQSTSGNRPLRKTASINSLDALLFDGSNDGLSFSGNIENGSGYVSLYVVARKTSTSGVGFLLNKDAFNVSPRAHQFLRINGTNAETHWWTPTLQAPTQGTVSANTTFLASLRLGADNGVVGLNGVEGTVDSDVSGITTTNQPTQIGSYLSMQDFFGGHICEIVAYDNKISNTDADAVEAYLMAKWGIS